MNLDELLATFTPATQEQAKAQGALFDALADSLLWLDDGISKDDDQELAPPDSLGVVLYDENGKAVNLLSLANNKTINHHAGVAIMGDINAPTAYLVAGIDEAMQLWQVLDAKSVGKHEPFCVLACMPYHLPKIAKAWQWQKELIIPINTTDHMADKLVGVRCHIHAYIDPIQGIHNDHEPQTIINQDGGFYHQGGEFILKDNALYHETPSDDGVQSVWICGKLHIDGMSRDKTGKNWGRLVRFYDDDGICHRWAMPNALLQGDSREYRKELASMGLMMNTNANAKRLLNAYLQHHPNRQKVLSVDSVGWHDMGDKMAYVLPHKIYGNGLILQETDTAHGYSTKGTLQSWQENISKPIAEQHRLAFALCVALAGTVLTPLGFDGMGFHFVGASSMGKSLALKIASSVWGKPSDFMRTWRATANGLESVANLHHDSFLALDELGQANSKQIGEIVYMLSDGQGKSRMSKDGKAKTAKAWKTAILSTGELSIKQMMSEAGQSTKAGQEVRLAHIRADAGAGFGMLNHLTHDTAQQTVNALETALKSHYGMAGMAWLDYLTANLETAKKDILASIGEFMMAYDDLSSQQGRVARRFAIVAGVGELATKMGLTGWQTGQAMTAVKACFDDWLTNYGTDDLELSILLERINDSIERHEFSRFVRIEPNHTKSDIHSVANFMGYIKAIDGTVYYLFNNSGFVETIGNFDKQDSLVKLKNLHLLRCNHGNKLRVRELGIFYAIDEKIREF